MHFNIGADESDFWPSRAFVAVLPVLRHRLATRRRPVWREQHHAGSGISRGPLGSAVHVRDDNGDENHQDPFSLPSVRGEIFNSRRT